LQKNAEKIRPCPEKPNKTKQKPTRFLTFRPTVLYLVMGENTPGFFDKCNALGQLGTANLSRRGDSS
jgi:hypothetical protein